MLDPSDFTAFGEMLSFARSKLRKSRAEMDILCGIKVGMTAHWEKSDYTPKREKLSLIAQAYEVDLDLLTHNFERSVSARSQVTSARRKGKPRRKNADCEVFGSAESSRCGYVSSYTPRRGAHA